MKILDGKSTSASVKAMIKKQANSLIEVGIKPALAVILVGENKASKTYVNAKEKACKECDIASIIHRLPEQTKQEELLALINVLNIDDSVDAILVQLPLPKHIDEKIVLESIKDSKDVDGFHALNVGKLSSGLDGFVPCTPLGVKVMLDEYGIDVSGLNAVVVGRSNIVGKPMANLLLNANATVTIAHSHTKNLSEICKNADLIVAAIGKPKFITADMVRDKAVVVDVGINRLDDGSLCGDVDYENVSKKASFITPVPGGVGPMTIAMLLSNTIKSATNRAKKLGLK
ncbi:Bifunctional protein FolD protein [Campylobacter majalis]|uniref:Bifunctional protein FolD n=1 Tax=Campylobacter majalis TaxID=2790656 RepID=A0ABN7K8C6_9BACT|nr:bifunctional methylenetetrahydrofolate dehydrogenase/methenyltetrahydrofolate cyclohydrolase FolD [Campylobacter majalis]CAD7287017.1 Bifunctional protein FolD protein [Campylobacter majalis]